MSRMCLRIRTMPAVSVLVSRSSTIRPPSGRSSKTCAEVYWLTPITISPRDCIAAKALSGGVVALAAPLRGPLHATAAHASARRRDSVPMPRVPITDTRRRLPDLLGSSIAMKASRRVGPRAHPPLAGHGHSGSSEQPGHARGNRAVLAWHRVHHEGPRLPDQAAQQWEGGVQAV